MLIARQNGHIDHVPWMKKPADPVKEKEREKTAEKERLLGPNPPHFTDTDTHTHTHTHARSFALMSPEKSTKAKRPSMPSLLNTTEGICKKLAPWCGSTCACVKFMDDVCVWGGKDRPHVSDLPTLKGTGTGHPFM